MIKTEKKHQNRNLKTANLLNRFPAIFLIITLLFSFSCKNDENGTNSDSEGDDSVMVDTLGQNLKRVIIKRHENGKPNIAHYIKDEGDYLYMQSWESGKKYISGWYKNNKREGEWISWYENGQLWSKGNFDNGKREGKSKVYFDNGSLRIDQEHKNGIPHGKWTFYDKNSDKTLIIVYDEGEKISEERY